MNEMDIGRDFDKSLGDGNVAAAIRAGMLCNGHKLEEINDIPYLIVPKGAGVVSLEDSLPAPRRIKASKSFEEPDSFCKYVAQFQNELTRVYGTPDKYGIGAILDDHQAGDPQWTDHRASLELVKSPEWNEWIAACGKELGQQELAEFLEDHLEQIASPDAGELLSDIRSVHISTNTRCESVQREGGDIAFVYATETAAGTKTERGKIPSKLTLLIAPFRSWQPLQMTVTLNHRLTKDKELCFVMRAHRAEQLMLASYADVRKYVGDTLSLPVLI